VPKFDASFTMKDENLRLAGNAVYLRYPKDTDFDEISTLYRSSEGRFHNFFQSGYDRATFEALLTDMKSDALEPFYICGKDSGIILGTITLSQIFRKRFQNAYLGYMLASKYTGNGFMTESVQLVLRFAFNTLKLHRVEANVQPENRPSIAVLERTGFSKEGYSRKYLKIGGRWRDHERWAIIKDDWKRR
jgi:[ribosomal protein S5]-alanine N-acetyltransferase